jgi:hypothetical protein
LLLAATLKKPNLGQFIIESYIFEYSKRAQERENDSKFPISVSRFFLESPVVSSGIYREWLKLLPLNLLPPL